MYEMPITRTYDSIEGNGDVIFGSLYLDALEMTHPTPVVIFQLWQTFLHNVNMLIKVLHGPSVQQWLLEATSTLDQVLKNLKALMFGIYSMATSSMTDDKCKKLFGEDRITVLRRYQSGTRKALLRASYLRSRDIVILQAFVLLLV